MASHLNANITQHTQASNLSVIYYYDVEQGFSHVTRSDFYTQLQIFGNTNFDYLKCCISERKTNTCMKFTIVGIVCLWTNS